MITENLSTLKIHKLSQEQYDRELAAGRIDETALYLTPDEDGIVDNAAQLEGHPADYFATAEHAHTYESLIDAPNITQDPKDEVLYVVDESGNIIMQVDEDGLATTTVTAKSIAINGNSIEDIINSSYAANTFIIDGGNAALAESEALS